MKSPLFILVAAASLISTVAAVETPVARWPWKLELIASAPDIRHPSVVCAAPDGRILVAEDPMDISAPADARHGRIIAFHPDGRRSIFATNLYAVFGLQYLEGKVFVVHNPKFTVFKDAGDVGTEAEDLIESTNPNPWALEWNDHVPANFKLAMDGYFYMAVGDKGIYNARTKDGRTINLHGGGILRIKPDGTGAEIFSTGVRNILDVAITSEDELFTYDNTDEHDWMGRLTHMVDGGFYGYPHDFAPRRPYTLWMMHDFGGGAATGVFANTEDALPPEYHDNLFLADFGKRQIIRVVIERDGATFKVVRHEELFSEMPDSFRPVGIAPSHDGKGILICDWQHRDTKENVEVGRLWKLTYTGETFSKPKPRWHVSLALGKNPNATAQQLSDGLAHPSRNVRLSAQRELSRRGEMPRRFSGDHPAAALHALWAWPLVPKDYTQLSLGTNAALNRQQLRMFAHYPTGDAQRLCIRSLKDPEVSVRFQAATTLGRLEDDALRSVAALLDALPQTNSFTRFAIEKALNRLGRKDPKSWVLIVDRLKNTLPEVRQSISHALRETYDTNLVSELNRLVRDSASPDSSREAAIHLLAQVIRKLPEWKGEWWAYHPALSPPPIKTAAWECTDEIVSVLKQMLAVEPRLRLTTIRAFTTAHETSVAPGFRQLYSQVGTIKVHQEILHALTIFKDTNSAALVLTALHSSAPELIQPALILARYSHSPAVLAELPKFITNTTLSGDLRQEAIQTVGVMRDDEALPVLAAVIESADTKLRSAAINALGKIGGPRAARLLRSELDSTNSETKVLAARALGELKDTNAIPNLLLAYEKDATREAALDALLEIPHVSATDVYLAALGNANPTTRDRARKILEPFKEIALPAVRSRIETMRPVEIAEIRKLYGDRPDLTLVTREKTVPTVNDYMSAALENKGDIERGRAIFHNQAGVACIKCHTVAGQGDAVGPDMTTIGAQFPRTALIEHILDPSKSVREGYQQVLIETSDDESYSGLIKSESADSLTILTAQATLQTIPKSKITSRHNSSLSLMPDGLHLGLSVSEFADLIAYLESLKVASPPTTK